MMEVLSYVEFWRWDAQWYLIAVHQDAGGAFYTAEARLGPGDWIMVDASSAAEALQQMRVALAGAEAGGCPKGVFRGCALKEAALKWRLKLPSTTARSCFYST